ncbi:UDP-N-acetylmuramoyl-L-alanine--D-glutamate ligase [Cellulomonas bogoriensis]|uniref:UDP-N-acetylmuramoyl-L-alanine--D-glutamate ligase n=1 Tax=Cellulomonas bogoriensis TaxID=301388 RepID=UPI00055741FC|nr:UDP-N-acetylmuramoyl-L-alanine--D-glutamate ligase [Cellulomonas bogoriensis]
MPGVVPRAGDLDGARVLVAGLGVSGRAASEVLRHHGAKVWTLDHRAEDADLQDDGALDPTDFDLVVASPGWRPDGPLLAAAVTRGVPVWSEVELAWRTRASRGGRGPAPWLALTGTNGKTTTVGMLSSILQAAGLRAPAVGNVGTPVVEAVQDPAHDVLAVELSSFQLHFTHTVRARAAALLNLADDHLDWHGSMEAYAAAKARVLTGAEVACVYPARDGRLERLVGEAEVTEGARAVGTTLGAPGPGQLGVVESLLVDRAFHAPADDPRRASTAAELATVDDLSHLAGPSGTPAPHVIENALAASALARAHGVPTEAVAAGLRAFAPGAHRTRPVGVVDDVVFVDDSKATNAHAASAALASFPPGSVVWIAGGLAKGARFEELVRTHAERLVGVVLIGVDAAPLAEALTRHAPGVPVVRVDPADTGAVMTRAVHEARRMSRPGATVLLAPACASMDQFDSYAQRGELFAAAVRELAPDAPGGPRA